MAELPNVCLNLASRPENVLLVREMLTGVAETTDLDRNDLNEIWTAVTEACNNVVMHAYEHAEGPLEVEVYAYSRTIEVVVRDRGIGLSQACAAGETLGGLGLPIIRALVHNVNFRDAPGYGSEVRMEFATPSTRALASLRRDGLGFPLVEQTESATAMVAIAPIYLARTVLPRVLSVLAVHARFSTARICDAQLLADALAARASKSIGSSDRLNIAVNVEPRSLELRVGPLGRGGAQRLIMDSDVEGLGSVIEKLTDDHRVTSIGALEILALRLSDRPPDREIGCSPCG
jgi:serine/threonine-protein kinase RsbW